MAWILLVNRRMQTGYLVRFFAVVVGILSFATRGPAVENLWTGAGGDRQWNNPANWSLGVPDATQDVSIGAGGDYEVSLTGPGAAGTLTLSNQTGSLALTVRPGAVLHCLGAGVVGKGATLNLGGELDVDGSLQVDGALNWTNGVYRVLGLTLVTAAGNLALSAPGSNVLSGSIWNDGTLFCSATNLTLSGTNNNRMVLNSDINFDYFLNQCLMEVMPDKGPVILRGIFGSQGTVRVGTGTILQILAFNGMSMAFNDGSVFEGGGAVSFIEGYISFGRPIVINCTIEANLPANLVGNWYDTAVFTGPGLLRWKGAFIDNLTFAPNFHVEISGPDSTHVANTCTNLGTVRWITEGSWTALCGDLPLHGMFSNGGLFLVETNMDGYTNLENLCFVNLPGGTLRITDAIVTLGSITNEGNLELISGGVGLSGPLFCGSGSSYLLALGGHTAGKGFVPMAASSFTADGALIVALTSGFVPVAGDSFQFVAAGAVKGRFARAVLPPLASNLAWRLQYSASEIVLSVVSRPMMTAVTTRPDKGFELSVTGFGGSAVEIQSSTNLVDWITITTLDGLQDPVTYVDAAATNSDRRFYRCKMLNLGL